jgi:hypothetical protein
MSEQSAEKDTTRVAACVSIWGHYDAHEYVWTVCQRCGDARVIPTEQGACPTCGPTKTEPHPRRSGVTRCANCKEWLTRPIPPGSTGVTA